MLSQAELQLNLQFGLVAVKLEDFSNTRSLQQNSKAQWWATTSPTVVAMDDRSRAVEPPGMGLGESVVQ